MDKPLRIQLILKFLITMEMLLQLTTPRIFISYYSYRKIELLSLNSSTSIQGASTLTITEGLAVFDGVVLISYPGAMSQ